MTGRSKRSPAQFDRPGGSSVVFGDAGLDERGFGVAASEQAALRLRVPEALHRAELVRNLLQVALRHRIAYCAHLAAAVAVHRGAAVIDERDERALRVRR